MRALIVSGVAAAFALSLATPALAEATARNATAAAEQSGAASAAAAAPEERKVCRMVEMTGSRTKNKRVCLTRAEWQKVERDQ